MFALLAAETATATETALSINLDLAVIISAGLAFAAAISPIVVAILNNHHNNKIKTKELEHEQKLKEIDSKLILAQKRLDIEFTSKKAAFEKMYSSIAAYLADQDNDFLYSEACAYAYYASSMCSDIDSRHSINWFVTVLKKHPDRIDEELERLSDWISHELYPSDSSTD